MWQLRLLLSKLVGSTLAVTTDYAKVSGNLVAVKFDYIVLSVNANLLYIPLTSIKNVAY